MAIPIYIIGSSNTDMVVKAERLPAPGETILGGTFLMNAGGKGANQAVAAARLGGLVTLVANVGNDLFGKQSILQFKQENINTNYISVDPIQPSGVALINVNAKGENCIAVAPGANGQLTPVLLKKFFEAVKSPAIALVQLEIPITTVEYIIEQFKQRSIPVILNPAPAQILSKEVLRNVFLITPNETEAELLTAIRITNNASAQKAARVFHEMGIPNVVLTLGDRGAFWSSPKGSGLVSVPVVTAMDTTAAGDCFNGALAVALAEDRILDDAVQFACKAASISVTRMGAQSSMPTRKEVDAHK
jgi:ribokinase